LCFRGTSPTFVHIVKHNIDEKIRWVINARALHRQGPQLLCKFIPAKKLSDVNITDFQGTNILEGDEGNGTIEWELFVTFDQPGSAVWSESEAWNLGEGGVQILEICLYSSLLLLSSCCCTSRAQAEIVPQGRHARHYTSDTGDRMYRAMVGATSFGPL